MFWMPPTWKSGESLKSSITLCKINCSVKFERSSSYISMVVSISKSAGWGVGVACTQHVISSQVYDIQGLSNFNRYKSQCMSHAAYSYSFAHDGDHDTTTGCRDCARYISYSLPLRSILAFWNLVCCNVQMKTHVNQQLNSILLA